MKFFAATLLLALCLSSFNGASSANSTDSLDMAMGLNKNATNGTSAGAAGSYSSLTTLEDLFERVEIAATNLTIIRNAVVKISGQQYLKRRLAGGTSFFPADAFWAEGLKKLNATLEEAMASPLNMKALIVYHSCSTAVYPTLDSLKADKTILIDIVPYTLGVESTTPTESKSGVVLVAGQSKANIIMGPIVLNNGQTIVYIIDAVLIPPADLIAQATGSPAPAVAKPSNVTVNGTSNSTTTASNGAAAATFSLGAAAAVLLAALL